MYTSERGLARAAARGIRKPEAKLAGHLEPATLSEVYIARSRGMGQIASAITLENFGDVKNDFKKLQTALKIFSFFVRVFSDDEKDERIFFLLRGFLEALDDLSDCGNLRNKGDWGGRVRLLTLAFWWKLVDFLGQRPQVIKCAGCGKKLADGSQNFFDAEKGGVVCSGCAGVKNNLQSINNNQIKLLRLFLTNTLDKIVKVRVGNKDLAELEKVTDGFLKYNFG